MYSLLLSLAGALAVYGLATPPPSPSAECSTFANGLKLNKYHTTVTNATYFYNGTYVEADSASTNNYNFCQIYFTTAYGNPGDEMIWVLWLPDPDIYQNRFLAVGNGGFAGTIETVSMLADFNLGLGLAVAGGNGGHLAALNDAGEGAPDTYLPFLHDKYQVQGWIHNGISLFATAAQAVTKARYSKLSYSYYDGCSTGGAQGYALAQFHPTLFNGIVASSPGNYYSHLALSFLWNYLHTNTPTTMIPINQLTAMTNAVVAACDGEDGVEDGVIANPPSCTFDINTFACSSPNPSLNITDCLTDAQLGAAKAIYGGPNTTDTNAPIYPGFALGSESSWLYQEVALASAFSIPILQNLVYNDLTYNALTYQFTSKNVAIMNKKAGAYIDEISPNLQAYQSRGGKLLSVQGWADPLNAPYWPIEHLGQVEAAFGGSVNSWYELFMAAGAGHCGANAAFPNAPGTYATTAAMIAWVEQGTVPTEIEASGPTSGANITRKLCPYPQYAQYTSGDVDSWTSFTCSS